MELKIINQNEMRQNVYVYFCPDKKEGAIIDPGHNITEMKNYVYENEIKITIILLTHGHYDHILYAPEAAKYFEALICAHIDEKEVLAAPHLNFSNSPGRTAVSFSPDKLIWGGDEISIGNGSLKVIHTPGHTHGCICFYDEENARLFSGDTLFLESIGRTDLPKGSFNAIVKSVKERLFTLPHEVRVYPGHGASTTIGHEVVHNEISIRYGVDFNGI